MRQRYHLALPSRADFQVIVQRTSACGLYSTIQGALQKGAFHHQLSNLGMTFVYSSIVDLCRMAASLGKPCGHIFNRGSRPIPICVGCTPYCFDTSAIAISSRIASRATVRLKSGECSFGSSLSKVDPL
jgi:hypothetical protein